MKFYTIILFSLFFPCITYADNVILMIGDGMGINHLMCAEKNQPLFMTSLPVKGLVQTHAYNAKITDSAASATAYACGKKTNNRFLGKTPDKKDCLTIAEKAIQKGFSVGIYSTDHETGATPSAFYAHTTNRHDKQTISSFKKQAAKTMDIAVPVAKLSHIIDTKLHKLKSHNAVFFALFEGSKIDTFSHDGNLTQMKNELYDFDEAVKKAVNFIHQNPNTTLIVLADHETGGLTKQCIYTSKSHTAADVPLYAYGKHAHLFKGKQDNTSIYTKMHRILFQQ